MIGKAGLKECDSLLQSTYVSDDNECFDAAEIARMLTKIYHPGTGDEPFFHTYMPDQLSDKLCNLDGSHRTIESIVRYVH